MSSKCFILRGSQIVMNFVLSKLKSLFDNFSHISYWRNSLGNTCKRLYNIENVKSWCLVYILEKVKFQTVVFGFTYH